MANCSRPRPRSLVVFIGNGMGVGHVSAEYYLNDASPFADFPVSGLLDTRPAGDRWITDAAAAATALATGRQVTPGEMEADIDGHSYPTLLEVAKESGKSTGVIATTSLTYAIPSAFIVHSKYWGREYEIAHKIFNSGTDVLLGGGARFFENNTIADTNLIDLMVEEGYSYISQQSQLEVLDPQDTDKLLGLFAEEALRQANHRSLSLTMMTEKAIGVLEKNRNGFALIVDGSQIDWRAHERDDDGMLAELRDFTDAISWALDYQNNHPELLIIVAGSNETGGLFLVQDSANRGQIGLKYNTSRHTANLCPVFASGPQAEIIRGILRIADMGKILIDYIRE